MTITPEIVMTHVKAMNPIYEMMDLRFSISDKSTFNAYLSLNESTKNHVNCVHAAFQFAAAEILGALVFLPLVPDRKFVPVVKSLKMDFFSPGLTDLKATAQFSSDQHDKLVKDLLSESRHRTDLQIFITDQNSGGISEAIIEYVIGDFL